ncbi:hypothetical protein RFM26_22015 [Mesorhizobium sp. VK23B]|uniref:HK97 gp10 family phage protein n=1 Tax=Mesorhizobium dulcispinae TaxID=3072316 RepID=A0ABU4XIY6_9HYPH|nr:MULTISPECIES: hypothetical protein [unclassified Mesorhizobium]MDX8468381.1 hypothetical protein [Mesorhizobium sp. VK23B]MDX8474719.1 hypothetical protein [Mesorhizobium sp. VK23A]
MSKFKEALERGKQAHRQQEKRNDKADTQTADFGAQAKAWLDDIVVASLEAARAEVAGEVTIYIDTTPRREVKAVTPSLRFQIYREGLEKKARKTFTVRVQLSGEASVSSPGMVAEDVGNIGERSAERFRNLVVRLIEDAAKGA